MSTLRLSHNLELSLAALYGGNTVPQHHEQAHDFLLQLQSRNLRRKLQSLLQSHRDKRNTKDIVAHPEVVSMGSTWLACMGLLCNPTGLNSSFRLFAAQTICHRVRRVRLAEAIDLEMEQTQDFNLPEALEWMRQIEDQLPTPQLAEAFVRWIPQQLIQSIVQKQWARIQQSHHQQCVLDEDLVKGELALWAILGIMYTTAQQQPSDQNTHPILQTLACTATTIAIRLKHNSKPLDIGLVDLFRQALGAISQHEGFDNHNVLEQVMHECLAALPDTILASPGGRLSIDPRVVEAVCTELRHSSMILWESISHTDNSILVLKTCERWAKFLALPAAFIDNTMPHVVHALSAAVDDHGQRVAFSYLIAIAESASWTLDQIVMLRLGRTDANQLVPSGKKKMGSRAKKRQQENMNNNNEESGGDIEDTKQEMNHRGEMCCRAMEGAWPILKQMLTEALREADERSLVDGEGPLGYFTIAVNAFLPHSVRKRRWYDQERSISIAFRDLCGSKNAVVRGLCIEPLYSLHSALIDSINEHGPVEPDFIGCLVEHFFESGMRLAASCAYPKNYFDDMTLQSLEELEIERNDVRDLLRAVCGSDDMEILDHSVNVETLNRVLGACYEATKHAKQGNYIIHETVVHAFSSLAKPLYNVARAYSLLDNAPANTCAPLTLCGDILLEMNVSLLNHFQTEPVRELLPVVRLLHMATSSLAPFFDITVATRLLSESCVREIIISSIKLSMLSLRCIPELFGPSSLESNPFDIRGTMRSPGGEDHVGALALVRLAFESERLRPLFIDAAQSTKQQFIEIYGYLQNCEIRRGRHVQHGEGVGTKSRRILLKLLCILESNVDGDPSRSSLLQGIVSQAIGSVESLRQDMSPDENSLGNLADALLDFAAFSTPILRSLLHDYDDWQKITTRIITSGYEGKWTSEQAAFEWNRSRGAIYALFVASKSTMLSTSSLSTLASITHAECQCILECCSAGPEAANNVFVDGLVSPDGIPPGIFIASLLDHDENSAGICLELLLHLKSAVFPVILHSCADPQTFVDPRPAVFEAWLLVVMHLSKSKSFTTEQIEKLQLLLIETCHTALLLLMYPSLSRSYEERRYDPGMQVDGPHILVLMDFLASFFRLGPSLLVRLSQLLLQSLSVDYSSTNAVFTGPALVAAILLRGTQGALPPWAVEFLPEIYEAFYVALEVNPISFHEVFKASLGLSLSVDFGGVKAGQPIAGRLFVENNESFLQNVTILASKNDAASWRRLKVIVKQACGGKKKESDFRQKPALTSWNVMQAELPTY